jgi:hypothetical protein
LKPLHTEICDIIEDRDDLTFGSVALSIGTTKQGMSNFKAKGNLGFRKLLRLSYVLFPDQQNEVMSNWCLRVDSTESIKQSFEYAAITRDKGLLLGLINKYKKEKGTVGEYVSVYTIIYKYMINEIEGADLIKSLKKINGVKDEALEVLIDIIKCYNYYFDKKFHLMLDTATQAEQKLSLLSDKRELFIKECFLHRLAEVLSPAYLFLNNLKTSRHYAFMIINANICAKTVSDASYIVGMTYLLEDKEMAIKFLQQSYDISKTIEDIDIREEAKLNLDFAKVYLGINLDNTSNEQLINFQNNRNSESFKLVKEAVYQRDDEDFLKLFESLVNEEPGSIYNCFGEFHSQTNLYFASLAMNEIAKTDDNVLLMQQLINLKLNSEGDVLFEKDYIRCFSSNNISDGIYCA